MTTNIDTVELVALTSDGTPDLDLGLGAPAGANGLNATSYTFTQPYPGVLRANGYDQNGNPTSYSDFALPQGLPGAPGANGVTPIFVGGNVVLQPNGAQPAISIRSTTTPNTYAVDLYLTAPPPITALASWQSPPTPWAAVTDYTANVPASTVTYGGQTYVCFISHKSGQSFDASKWVLIAAKGTDGTGSLNGPAGSTDSAIALFDGVTGRLLKDSGKRLSDLGVNIQRSARTFNTQLVANDKGSLVDCSGSFPQTFDTSANLGAGWWVPFKNSGIGVIVLDPNGTETIDGRPFINVYPGESFTIQCDGANLRTIGRARRVLISDVTLTTAAAAIDVEGFAGDTELYSLDLEGMPVTNTGVIILKKNGAYIAANSGTYSNTRIQGASNSVGGFTNASPLAMLAANLSIGSVRNLQSTAANGVKLSLIQGDGLNTTSLAVATESTAALLQGIRLLGAGGNLDIGTNFRVWGNR